MWNKAAALIVAFALGCVAGHYLSPPLLMFVGSPYADIRSNRIEIESAYKRNEELSAIVATLRAGESERERGAIQQANKLAAQVQSDARKHTKALLAEKTKVSRLERENEQLTRQVERLERESSPAE